MPHPQRQMPHPQDLKAIRRKRLSKAPPFPPIFLDVYDGDIKTVQHKIGQDPTLLSVKTIADEYFHDVGKLPGGAGLLLMASMRGHHHLVTWLLEIGGKADGSRRVKQAGYKQLGFRPSPIHSLHFFTYPHTADICEGNTDNFDAIQAASWTGNVHILLILIEKASQLNSVEDAIRLNVSLQRGLVWATIKGNDEVAKLLMRHQLEVEGSEGCDGEMNNRRNTIPATEAMV